jgi:hypothetical protein
MHDDNGKIIWTSDKHLALQFRTRAEAAHAAKKLGFPSKSPMRIEIMGFLIWAISDNHCRLLTKDGFAYLNAEREAAREAIRLRAFACL